MTIYAAVCATCQHPISALSELALVQAMAAHNATHTDGMAVWALRGCQTPPLGVRIEHA